MSGLLFTDTTTGTTLLKYLLGISIDAFYSINNTTHALRTSSNGNLGNLYIPGGDAMGQGALFSPAVDGKVDWQCQKTPSMNGTLARITCEVFSYTAPVTLSGGGGAMIASTLNVSVSASFTLGGTFKIPLTAGGTLRINTPLANQWLNSLLNGTSQYAAPALAQGGVLSFHTGTQPASANDAPSGTLLGSVTMALSNYNTPANGSASLAAAINFTPSVSGTPTWARWQKGALVLDGSVGVGAEDFVVSSNAWISGQTVSLLAATLSAPV